MRLEALPPLPYLLLLLGCAHPAATARPTASDLAPLEARVAAIAARAGGQVSVAITQVESARAVALAGASAQPLWSVVKLPVAIVLLREQAAGRTDLALDRKVRVDPADVLPGAPGNTARWKDVPKELTIRELLALSL